MLLFTILILFLLLFLSLPVFAVLGNLALILEWKYSSLPIHRAVGEITWSSSSDFLLLSIPLFVLLGEVILNSGIADKMYTSMNRWVSWIPGGLMHSNIASCALFSATSGSSVATAATIGTVATPQIEKRKYNERLFLGSLASGGTLGILIPPSVGLIIYGILTETSISKLYMAGLIPGILLAFLFTLVIVAMCLVKPIFRGIKQTYTWKEKIEVLPNLLPPIFVFSVVIGSIYTGYATPTESAALGVISALLIAYKNKTLTFKMVKTSLVKTISTTAMVMIIIITAYYLNFVLSAVNLTNLLNDYITSLTLSPMLIMMVIIGFYILLGFFMETISMTITTVPILAPIIFSLGFDPIWFGVLLMVLLEMALITPPVGLNIFVIQGIRSNDTQIIDVIIGVIPFVICMFIMLIFLLFFPELATYLPNLLS